MPDTRRNVLVLTVDAIRADRTSLFGYDRPTTPVLERLADEALVCEQSFALGAFTQTACVQIMTSSRPLSYGGYDFGAHGRPPTIFKRFHEAGYHTSCLSTLHWVNRFFGYGDGLDEEYQLFGLNTLPGVALAMMRSSLQGFHAGEIPQDVMLESVKPVLVKFFDDTIEYCDLSIERTDELRADFPDSPQVNAGYDMVRVKKLISRHRDEFMSGKLAYIRKHLLPAPNYDDWMQRWLPREWYYCRVPSVMLANGLHRAGNRILKLFNPSLARARDNRFKIYPDARALADKVISTMANRDPSKPFFIWTHFMDTHVPYVSGGGRAWYRETPGHLEALGYPRDLDPSVTFDSKPKRDEDKPVFSALYDASIRFTDRQIGRIVDSLDRLGLGDDTVVVISGDHGEDLGDHGDFGHFFQLYGEYTQVPTLFYLRGMEGRRIKHLSTILDIAPTTAALAGIDPANGWEGVDLSDPGAPSRDHVLMESFYSGNCLFEHRPLYFGVRTADYHYVWREYLDPVDTFSPARVELFDVRADPRQQQNIYDDAHPAVSGFNRIIAERLAEIPEVTSERIIAAFGSLGEEVVRMRRPDRPATMKTPA